MLSGGTYVRVDYFVDYFGRSGDPERSRPRRIDEGRAGLAGKGGPLGGGGKTQDRSSRSASKADEVTLGQIRGWGCPGGIDLRQGAPWASAGAQNGVFGVL